MDIQQKLQACGVKLQACGLATPHNMLQEEKCEL
jgi:hypothetical protein